MRCGSAALVNGATREGKITDAAGVGRTLKALLARTEITQTRAMVAVGDAMGTFRVLRIPPSATRKEVDAAIARELPFDPARTATRWFDLPTAPDTKLVYAVAWERALLKNVVEAVRQAGVEPTVVELKSASIARAAPTEACIVIDLCSAPADLILVDRHLARVWHSVLVPEPLGKEAAATLARAARSMLRFYRRLPDAEFGELAPLFVSSDQVLPADTLAELGSLVSQPVHALPAPARVPGEVRHSTYLACLGLLMRRASV